MENLIKELKAICSDAYTERANIDEDRLDLGRATNNLEAETMDDDVKIDKLLELLTDACNKMHDASEKIHDLQITLEAAIENIEYEEAAQRIRAT